MLLLNLIQIYFFFNSSALKYHFDLTNQYYVFQSGYTNNEFNQHWTPSIKSPSRQSDIRVSSQGFGKSMSLECFQNAVINIRDIEIKKISNGVNGSSNNCTIPSAIDYIQKLCHQQSKCSLTFSSTLYDPNNCFKYDAPMILVDYSCEIRNQEPTVLYNGLTNSYIEGVSSDYLVIPDYTVECIRDKQIKIDVKKNLQDAIRWCENIESCQLVKWNEQDKHAIACSSYNFDIHRQKDIYLAYDYNLVKLRSFAVYTNMASYCTKKARKNIINLGRNFGFDITEVARTCTNDPTCNYFTIYLNAKTLEFHYIICKEPPLLLPRMGTITAVKNAVQSNKTPKLNTYLSKSETAEFDQGYPSESQV